MTQIKSLLLVIVASITITSCGLMGPSTDQAVEYNDNVIEKQVAIMEAIGVLEESYNDFVPADMDAALEAAIKKTEAGITFLEGLEEFGGSTEFKDNSLKLFNVYLSVLENEYSEMVEIYKLPSEEYTETKQERWGDLYDDAYDKMSDALDDFNTFQATFAVKYNFIVVEDKF